MSPLALYILILKFIFVTFIGCAQERKKTLLLGKEFLVIIQSMLIFNHCIETKYLPTLRY